MAESIICATVSPCPGDTERWVVNAWQRASIFVSKFSTPVREEAEKRAEEVSQRGWIDPCYWYVERR